MRRARPGGTCLAGAGLSIPSVLRGQGGERYASPWQQERHRKKAGGRVDRHATHVVSNSR